MRSSVVPLFFLYGEPPQAVGDRFLHLERLDDRSRPSNWIIAPHSHANLSHIFHIETGRGLMSADGQSVAFAAPCILTVPSGIVHGFSFDLDTTGSVLTIAKPYEDDLLRREADLVPAMATAACLALPNGHGFERSYAALDRELMWSAPGHRAAVDGLLLTILVDALRLVHQADATSAPLGPQALLMARFRVLIEERFRTWVSIETYARHLKVSPRRLREASLRIAGERPNRLIQARLLLEAKRTLLYTNLTIAEAAYHLGFRDAAYFSRFFSKAEGEAPRAFRDRHGAGAKRRANSKSVAPI